MKKYAISMILVIVIIASFAPVALASNDILENNWAIMAQLPTDEETLRILTLPSFGIESDHPDIIAKAQEITAGFTSDMDKARAIHFWVATNVWYDMDYLPLYETGNTIISDFYAISENDRAINVLESRRGLCGGYTMLTIALLRAVGIPAATNGSDAHWWYLAYVDGRWITGDAQKNRDFDMSMEALARGWQESPLVYKMEERWSIDIIDELVRLHTPPILTVSRTNVLLNGECLGAEPVIINGRTMVPMRVIFEALGAKVEWDGSLQRIDARRGNLLIRLHINHERVLIWDNSNPDNQTLVIDQPPTIINGITFVPLRFVGEVLGAQVNWVG